MISRGHPLLAVLGGWIGGRAVTWEAPEPAGPVAAAAQAGPASGPAQAGAEGLQSMPGEPYYPAYADADGGPHPPMGGPVPVRYGVRYVGISPAAGGLQLPGGPAYLPQLRRDFASFEPLPRFYAPEPAGNGASADIPPQPPAADGRRRRWSMDAWALLRRDGAGTPASAGIAPAAYGASQVGAVLRYRLAMNSRNRPALYLRSTSATGQVREAAVAAGFSARPIAAVPVIAALEGRVTDQGGRRRIGGAAMAVTELPAFPLPGGFRGEAYAQAGYVAGKFATPFADGQLRADHALVTLGRIDARVGAGLWGGAQKGAARLDAGPTASIAMPLSRRMYGRVAVDWRFRLAGDAVPDSGPALTLSAGF